MTDTQTQALLKDIAEFWPGSEGEEWLHLPNRFLNGDTPAQRLQEGRLDDVRAIIKGLKDGVVV